MKPDNQHVALKLFVETGLVCACLFSDGKHCINDSFDNNYT